MKKIKGFRVWLTSSSDYGIVEKPIDIFFVHALKLKKQ